MYTICIYIHILAYRTQEAIELHLPRPVALNLLPRAAAPPTPARMRACVSCTQLLRRQYGYFCTSKASKLSIACSAPSNPGTQLLRRPYLYFCTLVKQVNSVPGPNDARSRLSISNRSCWLASASIREEAVRDPKICLIASSSDALRHTSAYVSTRSRSSGQHTSAYVCLIPSSSEHTSSYVSIRRIPAAIALLN